MRRTHVARLLIGVVLSWSGMTSPDVIREGLLFAGPFSNIPKISGAAATARTKAGAWAVLRALSP